MGMAVGGQGIQAGGCRTGGPNGAGQIGQQQGGGDALKQIKELLEKILQKVNGQEQQQGAGKCGGGQQAGGEDDLATLLKKLKELIEQNPQAFQQAMQQNPQAFQVMSAALSGGGGGGSVAKA